MRYEIPNTQYATRCTLYAVVPSTTVENSLQINPFYAKQTQFYGGSNKHKHFCNNEIRKFKHFDECQNKAKTKPICRKGENERFCVDREPYDCFNNASRGIYHPKGCQFQTSDICLQFSDEAQFLYNLSTLMIRKRHQKPIGNEVDIYTLLCHYIKVLSTEFGLLTLEVVRRLKLKIQHNEKHRNQLDLERGTYEQR
jgi:hypothetical protein